MAAGKSSVQPTRPRKVSFSNAPLEPLGKKAAPAPSPFSATGPPSSPPTRRTRPFLARSPFPSSSSGADLSAASGPSSPIGGPSTPTRILFSRQDRGDKAERPILAHPKPVVTPPRRRHVKNESMGDVFLESWDVPRPPPSDIEPDCPGLESEAPTPSPSPKKMHRILDFGRGSTPLVARGGSAFTPRPVKTTKEEFSPSRALGRKISLSNLGAAYAAVAAEEQLQLEADDETMEELEDFDGRDTSVSSYGSGNGPRAFPGLAKLESPVELVSTAQESSSAEVEQVLDTLDSPAVDDTPVIDTPAVDLGPPDEDEYDEDDEVELELDIRHLSLTSTENASSSDGGSAPTTPDKQRDRDLDVPLVPSGALSPAFSAMSKSATSESLGSPTESIEILSPRHSPPPLRTPSVPATPRNEATGYASDDSDIVVSRRRLVGRRIIASDDEDDAPRRPLRGLRGRIPAAIARLNAMQDSDEEPEFLVDSSYDISNESMGSLREFILEDSEVEEDIADGGEEEEAEDVDESSSSDVDSDEPVQVDGTTPLPPAIPVINLVSDSEDDAVEPSPKSSGAELHFTPPPAPATLPDISTLVLDDSPSPEKLRPPTRPKPRRQMSQREWEAHGMKYAQSLFDELDANVFEARLGKNGAGCTIKWDNRIVKSAGMAHRRSTKHKDGSSTTAIWIALSPKVLSEEKQIRDTLAHEMCHVANWVISKQFKNPHGKEFKSWGRKVMRSRPDISVTTKHDYVIKYKYEWQCTNVECRKIYKRHSKSIDTTRQVCGGCRSRLAPLFATKELSPYQQYVKMYMKTAQAAMPGATFGQISRALSDRWTAAKTASKDEHDAYWRSYGA